MNAKVNCKGWLSNYNIPLDIEIGFGSSPLIIELAKVQYNKKFIGIEKNDDYCRRASTKATIHALRNICVINSEALAYISDFVASNRVDTFHIYFPSPGPSALKLFSADFVDQIYRTLKVGGQLRLLTDDKQYFEEIYSLVNNDRWQHINWCRFNLKLPVGFLVGTNCERKYGSKYVLQIIKN